MTNKSDFNDITDRIEELVSIWEVKLLPLSHEAITERLNSQNRSIKQIIGHMIDSATNNQHRMVRLQYTESLDFPDYRNENDEWISIQNYQHEEWSLMIHLWKYINLHMAHLFLNIRTESLNNTWKDAENTSITLREMIEGYLVHFELHLLEITDLIDRKQ